MNKAVLTIVALLSLITSAYIGSSDLPDQYSLLYVLPLMSCVLYTILVGAIGNYKPNISTLLIIVLTFIRYCILPLLMVLSGYQTVMAHASLTNGNAAILLMAYEFCVITIALVIANRKKINAIQSSFVEERRGLLNFFVIGCLLYCILIVVVMPDIKEVFKSVIDIGEEDFTAREEVEGLEVGSMKRAMRTLFGVIFNVTRVLFPIYILQYVIKNRYSTTLVLLTICIIVILQFMLLTSTFAEAIVGTLIVLLSINKLDPQLAKKINLLAPIFSVLVVVVYFYSRYQIQTGFEVYTRNSPIEYASSIVSAYFTGIDNVSGALNMPNERTAEYFISSLITTIPFNTTLFGPRELSFQQFFNDYNGMSGQIPASVGDGYYYFGYVLAPIFSFLLTYFSVYFNRKAESITFLWKYVAYMFISIVLALGTAMYNEMISLSWVNCWGIPILIIALLVSKKCSRP